LFNEHTEFFSKKSTTPLNNTPPTKLAMVSTRSRGLLLESIDVNQNVSDVDDNIEQQQQQRKKKEKQQPSKRPRKPRSKIKKSLAEEFELEANESTENEGEFTSVAESEPAEQCVWKHTDFEILQALGRGAQSEVFKAKHLLSEQYFAIKMINYTLNTKYADRELAIHSAIQQQQVQQQYEEEEKAHLLGGQGIVKLYGHYFLNGNGETILKQGDEDKEQKIASEQEKKTLCLVLEYCPLTLLQKVQEEGRITEPEAARVLQQLVNALKLLHSNNIMHRDIKLSNILLTTNDFEDDDNDPETLTIVKLADFGIATTLKTTTLRNAKARYTIVGTSAYMAPEIDDSTDHTEVGRSVWEKQKQDGKLPELPPIGVDLLDSHYTTQVDVFGLGVTLHAMVTGNTPEINDDDTDSDFCFGCCSVHLEIPDFLSSNCMELLSGLLEDDPNRRLTLEQVQQHPWLLEHCQQSKEEQFV